MHNIAKGLLIIFTTLLGCSSCLGTDVIEPNIRTQPGIEYCDNWCKHMQDLTTVDIHPEICKAYLEPITLQEDAGVLDCKGFCEYEMSNSVQLNPQCMSEVLRCSQVECASRLSPEQCTNLSSLCTE